MRPGHLAIAVILGAVCCFARGASAEEAPAAKRPVADFSLKDHRGKSYALADFKDQKIVVLAFLGTQCPLAKAYAPRLAELAKAFEPRGVALVGINSNRQDSLSDVAEYARAHELNFPILKDPGNVVADQLGAVRTPEVFVLDQERIVRYRGRIDDQFGVGVQRSKVVQRDLVNALEELLAGKSVSLAETEPVGCFIGRVQKKESQGNVTYSNQIARLFQRRCLECHREGEVAPFALNSYDEAVGWGETIREVVSQGRMPPWFANPAHGSFKNDARLSDEEKSLIEAWVEDGCPEGDRNQLPPAREFVKGWQIPQPDQVFYISDEPVSVPAEGVVEYQYFLIDPGFTEDKWVQAAEARPDNRSVVHHIVVLVRRPNQRERRGLEGSLTGYATGMPPAKYPAGTAMHVPAGSKLIVQMHYTPNGSPQKDRSLFGLVYADPKEVKQKVRGGVVGNPSFEIPPGADNHEVVGRRFFREPVKLLTLTPHMHLRGKSFRYEAFYPDGRREVLLDVPKYDFNWQLRYDLAEPRLLPAHSWLVCTAHFDNSQDNPANPDPSKTVRWGDQTWEEMMIGYFTMIPAEDAQSPTDQEDAAKPAAQSPAAADKAPAAGR